MQSFSQRQPHSAHKIGTFMNKKIKPTLFLIALIAGNVCHSEDEIKSDTKSIKFNISKFNSPELKKQIKEIRIQKIQIEKSNLISSHTAKKITESLKKLSEEIYIEAKDSCPPPHNGPWGYDVRLGGIYHTEKFLSVLFNTTAVCYGNPTIDKVSKNYSILNGNEITPLKLIEELTPSLFKSGVTEQNNYIELSEESVNKLLDENKNIFPKDIKLACEEYLKNSFYSVWTQPGYLLLQPGFNHPLSICQKIFLIKL